MDKLYNIIFSTHTMEINFVYTLKVYLLLFLHNARDSPCS